ncbi:hypothetical protein FDH01_gp105 [Acinetobacter phage vB_AbaM_ME3]|uniref:Uncharacterized protein n=1 Tax=Acinetobacter phage vB_AbaM_ME3 TaxID=1837876 RepID=A0A172Q080_9CAUD|nr:hypothetical protein FDH01_gp105 [Acinetobacter phage vB_AbaM_ME3]AND75266.1 hypothetical protein ME3_105 [Acinetobacter phage vB_AbaM_ME3]
MIVPFFSINLKYIAYFIVGLIFTILVTNNYILHNKVKALNKEQENILIANQLALEKANIKIKSMTLEYQTLSKQREEQYEKKLKALNDQYNSTKSQLNSLQQSQSKIRSSIRNTSASREEVIKYVDRYENVFTECTTMLVEVAAEADRRGLIIQDLNSEIDQIYLILKEYKQEN